MKLKPLPFFSHGKSIVPFCLFLLISFFAFGQSETHDFVTYDTTINYSCNTGAGGCVIGGVAQAFRLRISRPRNYFTAGNADTASRPWFVTMQGKGEVGTDTNKLVTYGPHYWLNNGWDGGLQLGNGKHYPILITIMGQAANVTAPFVQALMDTLYKYFHPRLNSVHMAGLSMGVQVLTNYLGYEKVAGDEHNMSHVKSFVDLQGEGPDAIGADPMTYPTFFGHWAKKYGGTFFGLEGDSDSRNIWQITELMNDSVPNSAYFAYEHVGGAIGHGIHCCWNSMYDPSVTNWLDSPDSKITNPNIDPKYYQHPNTLGTYKVDPVTGTSIFQWMLRQGDTSLVGGGAPPNIPPVAHAGPDTTITLPVDSVVVTGSGTDADGTITAYAWTKLSGTGGTISAPSSATTTFKGLTAGIYKFVLTVTDNSGGTGKDTMQVTVDTAAYIPPTVSAGPDKTVTLPTDSVVLQGSATGHGTTIHQLSWNEVSGPNSATIVMTNANQTATIHGLIPGTYLFAIVAVDNHGLSASDSVMVTVDSAYIPPTVSAGPDKTVTLPTDSVVLLGSATGHGTTIHQLSWNEVSGPNSATIVMTNANQTATIHGLIQGTYVFAIVAVDNHGLSASDSVTVTVNLAPGGAGPKTFVAPGEYQVFFIDSSKHLYGVGSNLNTLGVSGAGVPGTKLAVAVPSNLRFKTAAAILHGGAAVDTAGNVWSWGDNDQGQVGNGSVSSSQVLTPVQVATDSSGNAFTGIISLYSYYTGNASQGWYAVKSDSTLWVWGQTFGGMRGNGTAGSTANTRPVQVPLPGGRKVMKTVAGDNLIVLFSDSTVWTCGGSGGNLGYTVSGTSYQSLQQLTTLSGIKDIAGGGLFNYALKSNGTLYGWGYYGYYMGGTGGANSPLATPTDLTTRLSLPHPIRSIAVNMNCTHVILSDSTLWGWGDNAQGCIGNGQELNFSTTPDPYAWSYAPAQLLQQSPVQVTSRNDFVALFSNYSFVMYTYAETAGGQLYSWGRNKGAVLGNGIVGCTSDIVATYPNSWDITTPTAVNPLSITSTTVGPCPYCVAHPTTSPCNTCTGGSATKPSVVSGSGLQLGTTETVPEQLLLYPTVSSDNEMLTMALSSNSLGSVRIRIMDMNGRVVKTMQTDKRSPYLNQMLATGHLPAGMYYVQVVIGNDKVFTTKFIRK